jgi:hypothetical protein
MSILPVVADVRSKHLLIVVFTVALGLFAAPVAAGTITVGWDLMSDPKVTGYRVYVGTAPGRYTQTFDVEADRSFYIFRNAFMGVRYFFAVAAQFEGSTYGPRSAEVTAVGTRTVGGDLPDDARVGDDVDASGCAADCYVATTLGRNLGEISSLAVSNRGLTFAVEGGRRVVTFVNGSPATVFAAQAGTTLQDIALDPAFDETGRVFVSALRQRDGASAELEVLRLRYLAGVLAEPAAIATGVTVPAGATVPLSVDRTGLLYLAVPVATGRGPFSSSVLAFDQDGRVPAGSRSGSPVIAAGLDHPEDLAWDDPTGMLWLAGRNGGGASQVLLVSREGTAAGALAVLGEADVVQAVAVANGPNRRLLIGAGVDLIEASPDGTDVLRVPFDDHGEVVAAASIPSGGHVVAVRRDAGSGGVYSVLRVESGLMRVTR